MYDSGKLMPSESTSIELHLQKCPQCQHALHSFDDTSDALITLVRKSANDADELDETTKLSLSKIFDNLGDKESVHIDRLHSQTDTAARDGLRRDWIDRCRRHGSCLSR